MATKATTKRSQKAKRPLTRMKLYQCRVVHRGALTHKSETGEERVGRPRVKRETIKAGVGAIGTLYRVDRDAHNKFIPIYEVRAIHTGRTGKLGLVTEDHTTPPPPPEAPDAHA